MKKNITYIIILLFVIVFALLTIRSIFPLSTKPLETANHSLKARETTAPVKKNKSRHQKDDIPISWHIEEINLLKTQDRELRSIKNTAVLDDLWLPETVRPIFDLNNQETFPERLKKVHSLSNTLNLKERYALYYFLSAGPDTDDGFVLKNDILNALREQKIPPEEFAEIMTYLFNDKTLHTVVRMYIIQHLRPWYEENTHDRDILRDVFYKALEETDNGIAGTSLLALGSLVNDFPAEFDYLKICETALDIASDSSASPLSRISAIQVCGRLNILEALPEIREIAANEQHTALRMAAIAGLGEIGDKTDQKLLQNLMNSSDKRYHTALKVAINKLQKRY